MPEDTPRSPIDDDGPSPGGVAAALHKTVIRQRLAASADQRARSRKAINEGRRLDAEQDPERRARFRARRIARVAPRGAEAWRGDVMEALGSAFLAEGAAIRRAVAYLEVNAPTGAVVGTGFLVSPDLLLTNNHVIADANAALAAQAFFDREADETGRPRIATSFLLDPERCFLASPQDALDYALVALGRRLSGEATPAELGFCRLSNEPDRHALGMNVNIIQHPRGLSKMAAIRKNLLLARTERTLHYQTDTDHGSSGSPVFNDDWDVVALHHWGEPFLEAVDDTGRKVAVNLNEGVRISAIFNDLKARLPTLLPGMRALVAAALEPAAPQGGGRRLGGPRRAPAVPAAPTIEPAEPWGLAPPPEPVAAGPRPALPTRATGEAIAMAEDGTTATLTIPLVVTIRLGTAVPVATASVAAEPSPRRLGAPRVLTGAAEALRRDTDYANRRGYDPAFIADADIPLPGLSAKLREELAPLRASEPDAAQGELKYVHFSVRMNKVRRIALYSATNLDGETYLEVDRDTGRVRAEGETWFQDPRISAGFVLDQRFYGEWSHLFDRGHLTRRTDPTWGEPREAERANADTFHFANCSPQHFRFNQSAEYWQGLERYVLENGVLEAGLGKRLTVIQGPVFDAAIDLWADDVQIPSSYFKVVAWKGRDGLKAVGLIADQKDLLGEERRFIGMPRDLPAVDVKQWRVSIRAIQKRTGLDFGEALREADTIRRRGQPLVGAEAAELVRGFGDIALE